MTLPPLPSGYEPHELPADYTGSLWIEGQMREYGAACAAWEREHGPCGHGAGCSYEAATRDAEIEAAVAAERERCADLCLQISYKQIDPAAYDGAEDCRKAILGDLPPYLKEQK